MGCPGLGQVASCGRQGCAGRGRHLTWVAFQLLTVDPKHRASSLQDMQAAPSLAGVLWQDLSEKKVAPGFVPNVSLRAVGGAPGGRGPTGVGWGSAPIPPTERPPALRPHL